MADPRLVSLLQLTGRALPTGAFAYSDGLERLWRLGLIATPDEVHAVLAAHHALSIASGDAWFARSAHRATAPLRHEALVACAREESAAVVAAVQRRASAAAGHGLLRAARGVATDEEAPALTRVADALGDDTPRATVFGSVAALWGIAEEQAVQAYAYTALAALVDAAVRLGAVPPLRGQRMLREVLADGPAPAAREAEPAYCSPLLDIALMGHETDDARHFAS